MSEIYFFSDDEKTEYIKENNLPGNIFMEENEESESESSGSENENNLPRNIFMDDEEYKNDESLIKKNIKKKDISCNIKPIIGNRPTIEYILPNANNYSYKTWNQCFPNKKVILRSLIFNPAWYDFFDIIQNKPYYKKMEKILSDLLEKDNETILPYAELVFNAFNILSPKKIRVVIIGQDPYPGAEKISGKMIPQATGFCFSTPLNYPKPSSLRNIYNNLLTYGHVNKIPEWGCLSMWVVQGCFMINATLTTFYKKICVHKNIWKSFTDDLLSYIDEKCKNVVFLVWGKEAHMMCKYIDPYKHHIITSSHPSPLACDKTFNGYSYGSLKNERDRKEVTYQSFSSIDHFGRVNNYLKTIGQKEIIWNLID